MLEVLLVWLVFGFTLVQLGTVVCRLMGGYLVGPGRYSVWIRFWTGFATLSVLGGLVSFFTPLSPIVKAAFWLLILISAVWVFQKNSREWKDSVLYFKKLHPAASLLGLLTMAVALLKAAGLPEIFDEGAYHLPLIRMWQNQGMVLGMANLNGHYGLNSTWHILSTLSNFDFFPFWKTTMALNGLVVVSLGWYSASRLQQILMAKAGISAWIAVFLPFFVFRNLISSPSTDIPAIVCTWFVFTLWIENIESQASSQSIWPVLLVLPCWIVMLKASSAALLLVPIGFLILMARQRHIVSLVGAAGLVLLMLFPWLLQNWLLTGYAIFPMKFTAIGSPAWQVPVSSIDKKFYLEQFGAFAPPKQYDLQWFTSWFSAHNTDTQLVLILASIGLVLGFFFLFRPKSQHIRARLCLFAVVATCLMVWLLTITEPRYGFGSLVIAALFPVAVVARLAYAKSLYVRYFALASIGLVGFNLAKTWASAKVEPLPLLWPAGRPEVLYRMVQCGNFQASTPMQYISKVPEGKPVFCWDCPFPCLPKEGIGDSARIFSVKFGSFDGFTFRPQQQHRK